MLDKYLTNVKYAKNKNKIEVYAIKITFLCKFSNCLYNCLKIKFY